MFFISGRNISVFFFLFPFCFEEKVAWYKEIGMASLNWLGIEVYSEAKIEAELPSRGSVLTQHMSKYRNEIFGCTVHLLNRGTLHFLLDCD